MGDFNRSGTDARGFSSLTTVRTELSRLGQTSEPLAGVTRYFRAALSSPREARAQELSLSAEGRTAVAQAWASTSRPGSLLHTRFAGCPFAQRSQVEHVTEDPGQTQNVISRLPHRAAEESDPRSHHIWPPEGRFVVHVRTMRPVDRCSTSSGHRAHPVTRRRGLLNGRSLFESADDVTKIRRMDTARPVHPRLAGTAAAVLRNDLLFGDQRRGRRHLDFGDR